MDLSEALERTAAPATPCIVIRAVDSLPEVAQRTDVLAALAEPSLTHARLARALTLMGASVKQDAVGKHRTGRCCCGA